jgi:hypothetical protein
MWHRHLACGFLLKRMGFRPSAGDNLPLRPVKWMQQMDITLAENKTDNVAQASCL